MSGGVYYNENDPKTAAWLRCLAKEGHVPKGRIDERSIEDVERVDATQAHFFAGIGGWPLALRIAGVREDANVWTGSCPCQPFSQAGRRRGTADERHLWPEWRRLIEIGRPTVLFGEQVASPAGRSWLAAVRADLEALGYAVGAADLCAAGIGAPHLRQRLYWVAHLPRHRWDEGCTLGRGGSSRSEKTEGRSRSSDDGVPCRLAVADGERREGERVQLRQRETRQAVPEARGGSTSRAVGGWDDVEWIPCGDGKLRPVESPHVKVADGISGDVGRLRTHEEVTDVAPPKKRTSQKMQVLQRSDAAQEIQRSTRRSKRLSSASILRPKVHGVLDGRESEGSGTAELSQTVCEGRQREVRVVPEDANADQIVRASHRWRYQEQFAVEFDDVVRLLSSSLSLAELHGDGRTQEALLVLQQAIREKGSLQHSSDSIEEAWRSLSFEDQERLRVDFGARNWIGIAPSPIAHGVPGRLVKLRGYGNAIVPALAAEFVQAALEVIP